MIVNRFKHFFLLFWKVIIPLLCYWFQVFVSLYLQIGYSQIDIGIYRILLFISGVAKVRPLFNRALWEMWLASRRLATSDILYMMDAVVVRVVAMVVVVVVRTAKKYFWFGTFEFIFFLPDIRWWINIFFLFQVFFLFVYAFFVVVVVPEYCLFEFVSYHHHHHYQEVYEWKFFMFFLFCFIEYKLIN
mgnify:CR=1 FL=1